MRRIKIEVRLLKAEQANCWRIVAATAPVKRPRIFIIRYPTLARLEGSTLLSSERSGTMKALCWHGAKDIRCDEVPDPRIEHPRDAIVKVTSCAICGSDLHL
jgi:hypothetical protein